MLFATADDACLRRCGIASAGITDTMMGGTVYLTLPNRADLLRAIDRIAMPANAKPPIIKLIDLTHFANGRIIHIGQHIVASVLDAMRAFPHLTFSILIAAALSLLITAIPIFSPLLNPLLRPVPLAVGVGVGALADFVSGGLGRPIELFATELRKRIDV